MNNNRIKEKESALFYCKNDNISNVRGNVLVLGDSIADGGSYVSYLNCYMKLFHPKEDITFINE